MYQAIFIHEDEFGDEQWQKYYDLLALLHRKYKATLTPKNWRELKERYLSLCKQFPDYKNMVIFEHNRPVVWADLRLFNRDTPNKTLCVSFNGDFEVMPLAIEKTILKLFLDEWDRHDCREAYCTLLNDHLQRCAQKWGAEELSRQDQYFLYRDKANRDAMRSWLEEIPTENPDLRIEFFDRIPDRFVSEYVRQLERNLREMPQEGRGSVPFNINEEEFKKQQEWHHRNNAEIYTYIVFDEKDKIVGSSATYINKNNPKAVHQFMTGVAKGYRRRGLAKWLKGRMFFKIEEDFPENEIIITEMRTVNEPILRINNKMGFHLERTGKEYLIRAEFIENYYNQLGT